jgi:hypothetical protein
MSAGPHSFRESDIKRAIRTCPEGWCVVIDLRRKRIILMPIQPGEAGEVSNSTKPNGSEPNEGATPLEQWRKKKGSGQS